MTAAHSRLGAVCPHSYNHSAVVYRRIFNLQFPIFPPKADPPPEGNEAPRSKASRYPKRNSPKPFTLLRQGYGGFSLPSSSQPVCVLRTGRQAARYSAKENKSVLISNFKLQNKS